MTIGERFPLSVKGPLDKIQSRIESCAVFQSVMKMPTTTETYAGGCSTCGLFHRLAECQHVDFSETMDGDRVCLACGLATTGEELEAMEFGENL